MENRRGPEAPMAIGGPPGPGTGHVAHPAQYCQNLIHLWELWAMEVPEHPTRKSKVVRYGEEEVAVGILLGCKEIHCGPAEVLPNPCCHVGWGHRQAPMEVV
ncbi:hypothetical protein Q8A73_013832 [Channa argus]|nr:hypothetical protein Q8A73_013832 [Channa argus]